MSDDVENYPEYEINSFMDFGKIPEDKLDHALVDFGMFIKQALQVKRDIEDVAELAKQMGLITEDEYPEGTDAVEFQKFIWIDDGKHEVTKTFHFIEKGTDDEPFLTVKEDDDGNVTVSGSVVDDNVGNV